MLRNLKKLPDCLIEWQLHTMVRPNEAVQAKWQDIDLLKTMTGDNEFLFPSFRVNSKGGHINSETVNKAFRRMELGGIQTAHGLRSIASTTLNEQGFDYGVIESALAHLDDNQVR
jgi:integrase